MHSVGVPANKVVRFQASLEDETHTEIGADLFVEIRKDLAHAIPTEAFDPDSKVGWWSCPCACLRCVCPVGVLTVLTAPHRTGCGWAVGSV